MRLDLLSQAQHKNRRLLPDFTGAPCPNNPRRLTQINVRFSDEVKKWIGYEQMRFLNSAGMYRWVTDHRRGAWQ